MNNQNSAQTPVNQRPDKNHPFVRLKRRAKLLYLRLLRLDDPPERIARGVAIGVCMGILPTFGIGGLVALGAAFIFKANKAAAVAGSVIMNPLTMPFFWTASITVGSWLLDENSATILATFKGEGYLAFAERAFFVYIAGNALIGAVFTMATYFAVKKGVTAHRARKEAKRRARGL